MFRIENRFLQRELLVSLRMTRAFVLLLVYFALSGANLWLFHRRWRVWS